MTSSKESTWLETLLPQLAKQTPFSLLSPDKISAWLSTGQSRFFKPGQKLVRPNELGDSVFLIVKGTIRLIVVGDESEGQFTLTKRGSGQLIGWASLLRGNEWDER